MAALTKTALLAFILLLPSYSQESSSTGGTREIMFMNYSNEKYVLFVGEFLDDPQAPQPVNTEQEPRGVIVFGERSTEARVKIKSAISNNINITHRIIIPQFDYFKTDCKDRNFEKNKDYLMIGFISYFLPNENIAYYFGENKLICNSIYDNTPENREMLTKKYNEIEIVY